MMMGHGRWGAGVLKLPRWSRDAIILKLVYGGGRDMDHGGTEKLEGHRHAGNTGGGGHMRGRRSSMSSQTGVCLYSCVCILVFSTCLSIGQNMGLLGSLSAV